MFEELWKIYPRKEGRKPAREKWDRLSEEQKRKAVEALPAHVKMWEGRDREFIPMLKTWIFQERFEDEIEPVQHKVTAWWTTEATTLAYGASKGVQPRPGEDMQTYRARLRAA